jgi:hypothetical protein
MEDCTPPLIGHVGVRNDYFLGKSHRVCFKLL